MDHRWMSTNQLSEEYANMVVKFIRFVINQHATNSGEVIRCHCMRWFCVKRMKVK